MVAKESFFIGIKNSDERHLRQIEAFPKQVYPNKHIEKSLSKVVKNLHPFKGIDIRMDIITSHAVSFEILVQFFSHTFCQSSNQHSFIRLSTFCDFLHQVIDLIKSRSHFDFRVEEACRAYHLVDNNAIALHEFEIGRSGTHIYSGMNEAFELFEF